MTDPAIFPIGATLVLGLEAVGATAAGLSDVALACLMKRHGRSGTDTIVAQWEVTPRPAAGRVGPGWTLSIAAEVSAALAPGLYFAEATVTFPSGEAQIAAPLWLQLVPAL